MRFYNLFGVQGNHQVVLLMPQRAVVLVSLIAFNVSFIQSRRNVQAAAEKTIVFYCSVVWPCGGVVCK